MKEELIKTKFNTITKIDAALKQSKLSTIGSREIKIARLKSLTYADLKKL